VVVFEPKAFSLIRQTGKFSLTETYLDLARDHRILGYDHSGDVLVDVGQRCCGRIIFCLATNQPAGWQVTRICTKRIPSS